MPRECLMQKLANGTFACLVCDYTSSKRYHMTRHLRKHSGELFHCSQCPQKFYEKCQLAAHALRHYGHGVAGDVVKAAEPESA